MSTGGRWAVGGAGPAAAARTSPSDRLENHVLRAGPRVTLPGGVIVPDLEEFAVPENGAHAVSALFSQGRLTVIPRRAVRREQLLRHLTETLFRPGRDYREREVNEALRTVHDDCAALRRYLVEDGWLERSADGSAYRRKR